jgi:putative endonuclease
MSPPPTAPARPTSSGQTSRQRLGRLGEDVAARYLQRSGWRILDRNVRCPAGELDIVADDGTSVVFVEVRTRSGAGFGAPEETITPAKTRRLLRCAMTYLASKQVLGRDWRVDLIAIHAAGDRITRLTHYPHVAQ